MARPSVVYLALTLGLTTFIVILFFRYSGLEPPMNSDVVDEKGLYDRASQLDIPNIIPLVVSSQPYYNKLCELDRYNFAYNLVTHIRNISSFRSKIEYL